MNGKMLILLFLEWRPYSVYDQELERWMEETAQTADRINKQKLLGISAKAYLHGLVVAGSDRLMEVPERDRFLKTVRDQLDEQIIMTTLYTDYLVPEHQYSYIIEEGIRLYESSRETANGQARLIQIGKTTESPEASQRVASMFAVLRNNVERRDFQLARVCFTMMYDQCRFGQPKTCSRTVFEAMTAAFLAEFALLDPRKEDALIRNLQQMVLGITWYRYVLGQIDLLCTEGQVPSGRYESFEQKVHRMIDPEIVNNKLDLKAAAEMFELTPSYFSQQFKVHMGTGFLNYIEALRMDLGYTLLFQKDLTVEEVAKTCGYDSVTTFRRNFKKHFGINPGFLRY